MYKHIPNDHISILNGSYPSFKQNYTSGALKPGVPAQS